MNAPAPVQPDVAARSDAVPRSPRPRLLIVIVCYRAADLAIDCLRSLAPDVSRLPGVRVALCENGTGPDSVAALRDAIQREGWSEWVELTEITPNRGFSGGNNAILRPWLARPADFVPEYVLLLNADTLVHPGAIEMLLRTADGHRYAGIISPRLEWPDGTPQESCFRDFRPLDELIAAARTAVVSRIFGRDGVALPVSAEPCEVEWTSFACALIRREVLQAVGVLDDGFYLYFDDPDFCLRARRAGWRVLYWPAARVVHLRGRSNPVKSLQAERKRRPAYWYESRARYYAKHYGWLGLLRANLFWHLGRSLSWLRERLGKPPHTCENEWRDIWINWRHPRNPPSRSVQS